MRTYTFARQWYPSARLTSNSKLSPLPRSNNMTSVHCTGLKFLQLGIFFMCDWRAGGGPLKLNMDPGLTLQSIGLFPASYQIHVLCPNIRIWLWPPMDFVFVCNESLSGDVVERFFSSRVKERLRLLVQAALGKGCGLQECDCWTQFLQIYTGNIYYGRRDCGDLKV